MSNAHDSAPLGALLRELKTQMHRNFIDYQVVHKNRVCNKPAHVLVAMGVTEPLGYHNVWFDDFPVDVIRAMYGDSAEQG